MSESNKTVFSPARQRRRQRMAIVGVSGALLALATFLMLRAFDDSIMFFLLPGEVSERGIAPGQRFRLGGVVERGSLSEADASVTIHFNMTDGVTKVPVSYTGLPPALFREGQCVVAEGSLDGQGHFTATTLLAKHDENYVPPEIAASQENGGMMDCQMPLAGDSSG